MDASQKLEIHGLLSRAAHSFAKHDRESLEKCFAAEATMLVNIADGSVFGPFIGRAPILDLMKGTLATRTDPRRHVFSNFVLDESGAETATVVSQIVLAFAENGEIKPFTSGAYRHKVRLIDGNRQVADLLLNPEFGF